jgi:hypothetical protein
MTRGSSLSPDNCEARVAIEVNKPEAEGGALPFAKNR